MVIFIEENLSRTRGVGKVDIAYSLMEPHIMENGRMITFSILEYILIKTNIS